VNIDPDGRVSFDKASYEKNCDKCCTDYEPEAGQNTALRWAAQPSCRSAWSSAFSGQSTLSDLLISAHPRVRYEKLPPGVIGQYRRWEGVIVQDCRAAKRRARNLSANNLIHELAHFSQWRRDALDAEISFWMDSSTNGPIESEAYGIASACLGSLGSTQ
jgi:hypothetical protein